MKPIGHGYKIESADQITPHLESTFVHKGGIVPMLLDAGDVLWRVIPTMKSAVFSDFWMDGATMQHIMGIIQSRGNFTEEAKVEIFMQSLGILYKWGEDARKKKAGDDEQKLARLDNWVNQLWKCKIVIKKPVVAYVGHAGPQKGFAADKSETERLGRPVEKAIEFKTGGFMQIVVPRFKGLKGSETNDWANISSPVKI